MGLRLSIKELGPEGRYGGAFSYFDGDKFWDLAKIKQIQRLNMVIYVMVIMVRYGMGIVWYGMICYGMVHGIV